MELPPYSAYNKRAFWLQTDSGKLFTWLYTPGSSSITETGVVLCPPIGHEYVHSHRTYRHVAEVLAAAGITVIRFDYAGTGDSSGTMLDAGLFNTWKANIAAQLDALRSFAHIKQAGLFGVRMGATLALEIAADVGLDYCLLWNPIIKGGRFVRELNAVSRLAEDGQKRDAKFYEAGGFPVTNELESDISGVDLLGRGSFKVDSVLLFRGSKVSADEERLITHLSARIKSLSSVSVNGYEAMMHEPQFTEVPEELMSELSSWAKQFARVSVREPELDSNHTSWSDARYKEQILKSKSGLFAISCEPLETEGSTLFILANSGSVHHVGPNRLYVEISRALAVHGLQVVRLDLPNLGDSAWRGAEHENTTYPPDACENIGEFLKTLSSIYPGKKIVLGGVCSGAYHAFHSALMFDPELLSEIVVINPLVFYWKQGMSLEIPASYEVNKNSKYYESTLKSGKSWIKLITGKADYQNIFRFVLQFAKEKSRVLIMSILGSLKLINKSQLAKDITNLVEKKLEVNFVFSSTDPGMGILKDEGGFYVKQFINKNNILIYEIPKADHTFSRADARKKLIQTLLTIFSG